MTRMTTAKRRNPLWGGVRRRTPKPVDEWRERLRGVIAATVWDKELTALLVDRAYRLGLHPDMLRGMSRGLLIETVLGIRHLSEISVILQSATREVDEIKSILRKLFSMYSIFIVKEEGAE